MKKKAKPVTIPKASDIKGEKKPMPSVVIHDADNTLFATLADLIASNIPGIPVFAGKNDYGLSVNRLALATQHDIEFVYVSQIIRIEGFKNYSTFHIRGRRPVTVSKNLISFERLLPESLFFRVHKSHIVNLMGVVRYHRKGGGAIWLEDDSEVPISSGRREALFEQLVQTGLV